MVGIVKTINNKQKGDFFEGKNNKSLPKEGLIFPNSPMVNKIHQNIMFSQVCGNFKDLKRRFVGRKC